jgi:hypothetical protein
LETGVIVIENSRGMGCSIVRIKILLCIIVHRMGVLQSETGLLVVLTYIELL